RPLEAWDRLGAPRGAAGRGGAAGGHRGFPGGGPRQNGSPAPVPQGRGRGDPGPGGLLPAGRRRRPGGAARPRPPGGPPRDTPRWGQAAVTAPLVLGIETSCDETGAGLVRGHELLADAVASSVDEHARFGGVVPEVASRAHLEAMVPAVDRALASAGVTLADVDALVVPAGPRLAGAIP